MLLNHASYQSAIYADPNKFRTILRKVVKAVRKHRKHHKFDAVAFRGTSGMAMGFPLCIALKLHPILIRKSTSDTHSCNLIEGPCGVDIKHYIIVDDLIASGSTMDEIKRALTGAKCVGIILYASDRDRNHGGTEVVACS